MEKLRKLMERRAKILEDLKTILDLADTEERDLTDEDETKYTGLETEMAGVDAEIKTEETRQARRKTIEAREAELALPVNQPPRMAATFSADDEKEFKFIADFLHSVIYDPMDPRLQDLYQGRAQSMGTGAKGGFMVPNQFVGNMLSVTPQEAIFRPRCHIIPAGDPPDAEITMPALEQGTSENMYGGVVFGWVAEGGAKPETDISLKEISWKPQEIAGHIITTDKLLRNWQAAASVIENQFRLAKIGVEDGVFYNGNGVGQPLGILNSPARIDYARATANQIAFADISGMYARARMGMNLVWITSQTTIPQLVNIQDGSSSNIWVQNAAVGLPPSLLGIPVLFSERALPLGTAGDLMLADLSYYYVKDGSGPFVQASEHVHFLTNRTVIKMFWNVDGHPWLNEPIPLEGSTTNTVSPFIVLN